MAANGTEKFDRPLVLDPPGGLRVGAVTLTGRRPANQDRMARVPSEFFGELVLVADGMGGHEGGERAAELVVAGFREVLAVSASMKGPEELLRECCRHANDAIITEIGEEAMRRGSGMGSTVVAALFCGAKLFIAWVGDSRAYLFRQGSLQLLTRDHTLVQEEVDQGLLTPEEAALDERGSTLTRVLGRTSGYDIEISTCDLLEGDGVMICSDGMHGVVEDGAMAKTLRTFASDPQQAAESLANLAWTIGSQDNITVQYCQMGVPLKAPPNFDFLPRSKRGPGGPGMLMQSAVEPEPSGRVAEAGIARGPEAILPPEPASVVAADPKPAIAQPQGIQAVPPNPEGTRSGYPAPRNPPAKAQSSMFLVVFASASVLLSVVIALIWFTPQIRKMLPFGSTGGNVEATKKSNAVTPKAADASPAPVQGSSVKVLAQDLIPNANRIVILWTVGGEKEEIMGLPMELGTGKDKVINSLKGIHKEGSPAKRQSFEKGVIEAITKAPARETNQRSAGRQ